MTLYIQIGDLLTAILFTVVQHLAIDVLLSTAVLNEHILGIKPDERKVNVRRSIPVAALKRHDESANAVLAKLNTQDANILTRFEAKEDRESTIKRSNTIRVTKKNMFDPLSITRIMGITKVKGFLHFDHKTQPLHRRLHAFKT